MPDGLRDRLREAAEGNKRAMNTEIVARLEDSFGPDNSAELRRQVAFLERHVMTLEKVRSATSESADATKAVADMYEQQVWELQDRLDQVARISKIVAAAIKDAAEGSSGDLKYLLESAHPFQDQGIPSNPEALLAKQYEFGLARLSDFPDDDRATAHARLVTLMEGSAELLGVEWTPPKWNDDL